MDEDGCPTFAQAYVGRKRWATRISCNVALTTSMCAAFIEESRMRLDNATKLNRKYGQKPNERF